MKQSVNFYDFVDRFHAYDRYDSYGYDGLRVIFDALEQYEDDTGEEIELDVIAICCDFNMLSSKDVAKDYGIDLSDCENDNDIHDTVEEYLQNNTWLLGETNGEFIFQVF